MNKQIVILTALILCNIVGFAQSYSEGISQAWKLYESEKYLESAKKYEKTFRENDYKGTATDRYNAACSWALANEPDSAFYHLLYIGENGMYSNFSHLSTDGDLNTLHGDTRWAELLSLVQANREKAEANWDKPLVALLDSIFDEDQKYRRQIEEIQKKYGGDSPEMMAHWKLITLKDSINLMKVKKILNERGWLGADVVSPKGNQTLFLVIQHADIETQEFYLPMMREAVAEGRAYPSALALLEDRVALRQGKKQIYGSQVGQDPESNEMYVLPLEDPDNVDLRRESVGLGKLQDYLSNWGMTWDPEVYKKALPEIEARSKKK